MLPHYLKIAFRNMRKYKNQTLISVIGLAVGFTCFTLSTLWIRYEMTYDSFHKNAGQIYVVYTPSSSSQTGYSRTATPLPLAAHLKNTFPEVVNAAPLNPAMIKREITVEDVEYSALIISVDSSFLKLFDIKILEGSQDFLILRSNNIAITQEKARQLFGNDSPIGKTIYRGTRETTICAVVSGMSKHSNYPFDFIEAFWTVSSDVVTMTGNVIIELLPGTNIEAFEKKLYEHEVILNERIRSFDKFKIAPLTKLRYTDPNTVREVKFQHILIFALSGLLVVLCSLFNYLTLYASRFRMRQKELALRVVCGASGVSLLVMLSVEFLLTLFFAVMLGCMLTQLLHKHFLTLSDIQMNLPAIYGESLMYIGGIILVSLLVFWLILFIFQRRSLNVSIRRSNKKLSRKISVVVQLLISVGFAFCTNVILKQMYFLHHTDELGFSFKNRGSLTIGVNSDILAHRLRQMPEITEVVDVMGHIGNLLPFSGFLSREVSSWDEQPADREIINLHLMFVPVEYIAFYEFRLVAGEMLTDADPESMVLLNESAVKAFGWHDPVGKQFDGKTFGYSSLQHCTVKGVIKHIYNSAPTMPAVPICYVKPPQQIEKSRHMMGIGNHRCLLFKYHEGMWNSCKEKIEQLKNEFSISRIYNDEEEYNKYLKSEKTLIKLLSFVSVICILICVFSFVSLVSLTCEERRKEIAIRKINGATVGNILAMFAKEYLILLIIGSMIAFTTGYFIMQRWLENYAIRTSIPVWIYLAIVFVLALVIVLCVGLQVYRASIENPAEVVKSE